MVGAVDAEQERQRLQKQLADVEKQLKATESKLANENFVARAKPDGHSMMMVGNGTTVTLTDQATSAAVAGSVAYDSANRIATFSPTAALGAGKTYLARIKGGTGGVTTSVDAPATTTRNPPGPATGAPASVVKARTPPPSESCG